MEADEPRKIPVHAIGDDLSRLSVAELTALREALIAEAERVAQELTQKAATRDAADSVFKLRS